MKILLIVRWPVGGIRTYLRYVYRRFPANEYNLTLLAPSHYELEILKEDLGVRLNKIIISRPTVWQLSTEIVKILRSEQFDLVHSHGLSAGLMAALPVKLSNVPHVVTLHDVFLDNMFIGYKGHAKKMAIDFGLRLPNIIHLLGSDPESNFLEFFPNLAARPGKIAIIRSGIEIERFSLNSDAAIETRSLIAHNIPASVPLLGFFGRFMAQKGFASLADAIEILLSEVGKVKVPIVVAFGEGGFLNREKRMLQERGLSAQFRFFPFVPNIATVMSELDGIVMPSKWEAVGLLAMEALVAGVPLLASNCLGLREVTKGTPTFTFPDSTPSVLAKTIMDWVNNPRKDEFKAFARCAASRFDIQKTAIKLQRLYSHLASGRPNSKSGIRSA